MPKYRVLVARLTAVACIAILAAEGACRDTLTAPRIHQDVTVSPTINVPGDSGAPELVFLAPLGPRHHSRGELDTTLAPSVIICKLSGDSCGADTVARFTSDTSAPAVRRVRLTDKAHVAEWNLSAVAPDTALAYRIVVALSDTIVGYTDAKVVPSNYQPAAADTARFAFITDRRTLNVRFQIFMPPEPLTVISEPGVHGSLPSGTTEYRHGERVSYQFEADSGYSNVLVTVDEEAYAPRHGRLTMNRPHVLVASADRVASIAPGDEWILRAGRALLRSATPVQTAQTLLDRLDNIADTTNLTERLERVERVLADADPSALRSLDAALAGHVFHATDGRGTEDPVATVPPPLHGGGGVAYNKLAPVAAPPTLLLPSRDQVISTARSRYEPLTIAYVNGILTTPFGALFSANEVARVARASHWNAAVPFDVRLLYNRTADADSPSDRCVMELARHSAGLGINALPVYLRQCQHGSSNGSQATHWGAIFKDFAEAGLQLNTILARSTLFHPADADSLAAITMRWRALGRHIVFVPHSQGNLMVQQGIELIRKQGNLHPAIDSTCIGAVSLAAPTSNNWPISSRHLIGLVSAHDPILLLGLNHFTQVQTPLSDSAMSGSEWFHKWNLQIHEISRGYLDQAPLRARIQEAIVHSYKSCALGNVAISPERVVLTAGATATFSATLRDLNGDALDGSRGVVWSGSTASDINRAVTVLPDGKVTANYVGSTGVSATTTTLVAIANVTVDAAHIMVGITEALSARWVLVATTAPDIPAGGLPTYPPVTAPDLSAPWNGDACIAKREITLQGGQIGQFSKNCTAKYEVSAEPIRNAARYEATFIEINHTNGLFTLADSRPRMLAEISGPVASLSPLPGPSLLDRVNVTAWDGAGHLLAFGTGCAHRCLGWSDLH